MQLPIEDNSNVTLQQLEEMCEYWKVQLGIADWAVEIKMIAQMDMNENGVAECSWILSRRIGFIKYSTPESRSVITLPDDAEMSLVHEMLHLVFGAWHDHVENCCRMSQVEVRVCCEQPIEQLSETLVLLRRSSGHRFSFEKESE